MGFYAKILIGWPHTVKMRAEEPELDGIDRIMLASERTGSNNDVPVGTAWLNPSGAP